MKKSLLLLYCLVLGLATLLAPVQAVAQVLSGTFAAGVNHSLSIHADGSLWATGDNTYGQLGIATTTVRTTAWVRVGTATNWVQVAAGNGYSLGLRTDGTLWAWGLNRDGQLGVATNSSTTTANPTPAQVGTDLYTQIIAGDSHSLGLRANGSLYAWGANYYGQLGNATNQGTYSPNPTPTRVGTAIYTQIAAGSGHSLGLRADGSLWAWGDNIVGQLAQSASSGGTSTPTRVGLDLYSQVAAGRNHSLGLRADGTLWAWGLNYFGELGNATNNGTSAANPTPTRVGTDLYTHVAAGTSYNLGLRADGSLWAWGSNSDGQLGTGAPISPIAANFTPARVGTERYVRVAAGRFHSLGLRADSRLYAWGANRNGQLGNDTNIDTTTPNPTPVATGTALPTRSTAVSTNFGLAVKADGTLWAWGNDGYGQLGDGTTTGASRVAKQIGTAHDWVMVATGFFHGLALKDDGTVWAWGYNEYGQLGSTTNNGTRTPVPTPAQVPGTYTLLAASSFFSLALRADGSLWAWGDNSSGQLGQGSRSLTSYYPTPTRVGTATYTNMASGQNHSLGLQADGTLWTWGGNSSGQLGLPVNTTVNTSSPNQLGTAVYTQVAAGTAYSLGLRADGSLWAWGINTYGQLGNTTKNGLNGTGSDNPTPTQVGTATYTQVASGTSHSLGLRADGSLWAWGMNRLGQLGNPTNTGTNNANPTPTQEATLSTTWATLATGADSNSSLARTASGLNFASTGYNDSGQLGDGTTSNANRFDRVSPLASLQPLPVQLIAFEVRRTGPTTAALSWATASELNNNYFEIEKSSDGHTWQSVATVPSAGGNAVHHYTYLDANAYTAAYYRLAQLDLDGTRTHSPVQYIAADGSSLSLYPNPGRTPALHGAAPGAPVFVFDARGSLVLTTSADGTGTARLHLPASLSPGIYLVRTSSQALRLSVP